MKALDTKDTMELLHLAVDVTGKGKCDGLKELDELEKRFKKYIELVKSVINKAQ